MKSETELKDELLQISFIAFGTRKLKAERNISLSRSFRCVCSLETYTGRKIDYKQFKGVGKSTEFMKGFHLKA